MDSNMSNIVDTTITLEPGGASQQNFGTMLFLAPVLFTTDRVTALSSGSWSSTLLNAGVPQDSPEYRAATTWFSGTPKPPYLYIGRQDVSTVAVFVKTVKAGAEYKVTINGTEFSYTTTYADESEIYSGLESAINAGSEPVTATASGSDYLTIQRTGSVAFTFYTSSNLEYSQHLQMVSIDNAASKTYEIDINYSTASYTAMVPPDDVDTIGASLEASVNALSEPCTAFYDTSADNLIIISDPGTAGVAIELDDSESDMSLSTSSIAETITAAITACKEASTLWYAFTISSRDREIQKEAAVKAETMFSICGYTTSDPNCYDETPDDDEDSIMVYLDDNNYNRSFAAYHPKADGTSKDKYFELAWFSYEFANVDLDLETSTWKFDTLSGVTSYSLTATQKQNIEGLPKSGTGGKHGNMYIEAGGIDITVQGWMGSGEFIQTILGRDWLTARITERAYDILQKNEVVPYTNAGFLALAGAVRETLTQGIETGFLVFDENKDETFGYTVEIKDRDDVPTTEIQNRYYKYITWSAKLAGAVHFADINGTLEY